MVKFERVNDNKIKITISLSDLQERNIDLDSLSYNSPQAQKLFWDMMERAEVEFGFDTSDSQICVEAMPNYPEGFIIIITKVEEDSPEFESINKYIKSKFRRTDLKIKKKSRKLHSPIMIYSFNNIDDVCALASKIFRMYLGESSLYHYKNTYYLTLTRNNIFEMNSKFFESLLSEYGSKVENTSFYEGFLEEYGSPIILDNAIEIVVSQLCTDTQE